MDDLELIFTMLGEAATTEITRNRNAQGFEDNKVAARTGGKIAGDARVKLEEESGRPVISNANYKHLTEAESHKTKSLGKGKVPKNEDKT